MLIRKSLEIAQMREKYISTCLNWLIINDFGAYTIRYFIYRKFYSSTAFMRQSINNTYERVEIKTEPLGSIKY